MIRLPGMKGVFALIISFLILIWILSGVFFFDRWNRLMQFSEIKISLVSAKVSFNKYIDYLGVRYVNPDSGLITAPENPEKAAAELVALQSSFDIFENSVPFISDPPSTRKIRTIKENLNELNRLANDFKNLAGQLKAQQVDALQAERIFHKIGSQDKGGILGDFFIHVKLIENLMDELYDFTSDFLSDYYKTYKTRLILLLIISCALICIVLYYFGNILSKQLSEIKKNTQELKEGKIPKNLQPGKFDEDIHIRGYLNELTVQLKEKAEFANNMVEGNYSTKFITAGKNDILGNHLLRLNEKLDLNEAEILRRIEEDNRRSWINEGLTKFGDIFRSERENVTELAYNIIFNLVKHIDASAAGIYLSTNENKGTYFDLIAAYAFDRRKYLQKQIQIGEGLVGTCALEKETIFMTDIPHDYLEISSGLGESKPISLLIIPLKNENFVFGVIEIASMKVIQSFEIDFVEQIAEITASTLASVKINERTSKLLEQSRRQAEEMLQQEERMKKNMAELQTNQKKYLNKEAIMAGILNAINSSSLYAEFTVNGRFSNINEKFLLLMETSRDQIIGKHHSDYAVTDKYSDDYKQFWNNINNGETIHIIEKYRLYSGKEVWLEESFSSVTDNEGKVVKIINIAHDITQLKAMQEELARKSVEIIRRNMDMETFYTAVSNSMIHCEILSDGIISAVNENFISLTGYSRRELLGKNFRIFLTDPEKELFEKVWIEVLKDKVYYSGVINRTKQTGEEVKLMATFSPVKNEEGNIYKVYFLATEITEMKLKDQLLEKASQEIEKLNIHIKTLQQNILSANNTPL